MTDAHQRKVRVATWQIALALFLLTGAITGLYFGFRYTLIADFVESQREVDVSDAYAHGELLFETRGCVACHSHDVLDADGDTGPDLTHIADRQDENYIQESITNPNAIIAENCPEEACEANIMPNYGAILDDAQVNALVVFLSTDHSTD